MEEDIIIYLLQKRKNFVHHRQILRHLRDNNDPFLMPENLFRKNYRLSKHLFKELLDELLPYDANSSIPFVHRFCCALYFYAKGSYQNCVGNSFCISLSQASVSNALHQITNLIIQKKKNEIRFPITAEETSVVKAGFYNAYGIKGTIGAIDCTHVAIISPPKTDTVNPPSLYMNRKGYYSVNVEATCDHRLLFTSLNAKYPGSCHDSGIWVSSSVRVHLMTHRISGEDAWLLGDQGYPLEPWLLTPVAQPSNIQEENFNKLHNSSRNIIERLFGVWKSRFRCLCKHRVLHYSHEKASKIIIACAILHNIILKNGGHIDNNEIDEEAQQEEINSTETTERSSYFTEGQRIRRRYIQTL